MSQNNNPRRHSRHKRSDETGPGIFDFKGQVESAGKMDSVDPLVAKLIAESGHQDGSATDDKISVSRKSWSAASLKPSQGTMILGKAIGMALGMLASGKVGGDLGAIISSDGHIMDGHHRWAATILASGSKGKVGGYGASLKGKELLKVLNIASKGMFGVRNGKPGKGRIADFSPKKVKDMLTDFSENGIGGSFPIPADKIQKILKDNFGSVEKGIKEMSDNVKLLETKVPSWAPARKQMPVIDPGNVPSAAKALNDGDIDWAAPYRQASHRLTASDRTELIRLASRMPKGSEERRSILAGLKQVKVSKLAKAVTAEDRYVTKLMQSLSSDLMSVDMLPRTKTGITPETQRKIAKLMEVAFDAISSIGDDLGIEIDF